MRARTLLAACAVVFYSAAGAPAEAQCGGGLLGLGYFLADPGKTALFSGTVTDVQGIDTFLVVTFDVERVWKGDLPKRLVIYRPAPRSGPELGGSSVTMYFEMGKRYVVVARHLNATERTQVGAERNPDALATEMCGGGSRPFELASGLGDLGAGWAPR